MNGTASEAAQAGSLGEEAVGADFCRSIKLNKIINLYNSQDLFIFFIKIY